MLNTINVGSVFIGSDEGLLKCGFLLKILLLSLFDLIVINFFLILLLLARVLLLNALHVFQSDAETGDRARSLKHDQENNNYQNVCRLVGQVELVVRFDFTHVGNDLILP